MRPLPTADDLYLGKNAPEDEKWREHEHVADEAQVAAQRLVDAAGSIELAKHALDAASEPNGRGDDHAPDHEQTEFARRLGFASYLDLFESSRPLVGPDESVWFVTTQSTEEFVVWSEQDLAATYRFNSLDEAAAAIAKGRLSDAPAN